MKILIVTLISVSLLSYGCKFFNKEEVNINDPDTLLVTPVDTVKKDTIKVQPEPKPDENGILTLDDIAGEYHVIIGSFQTKQYALEHAKKYKTFGYPTRVIRKPDGFYMVSLKKYNSMAEANADMPEFKKRLAVNSWVYGAI